MTKLFAEFDLPEKLKKSLASMKYTEATPIQAQSIPHALEGRDILGSAQTGTGKTAAFSIPMLVRLMNDENAMGLVLAPTRELAAQTLDVVHKLTNNNRDLRTALLIGGEPMGKQFAQLREGPRIIIGTPGRINDHLRRNGKMLKDVVFVAVDEADRMLDMGFSEQIDEIFATLPEQRQMVMFSATFPQSIIKFSRNYLNDPVRVSVDPEKVAAPKIKHEIKHTNEAGRYTDLLAELEAREGSVIVFVKTQHGTDRLATRLEKDGYDSIAIHGGLRQNQRDRAVRAFRSQRCRIMVATDVAARGLDIPHIEHVINYDLPQVAEDYIHRIGRTGRAGAEGSAVAFVMPGDTGKWNAIQRIMNPDEAPLRKERGGNRGQKPSFGNKRPYQKSGPNAGPRYGGKPGGYKSNDNKTRYRDESGDSRDFKKPRREWGEDRPFERKERPAFAGGEKRSAHKGEGFNRDGGFRDDRSKGDGFKGNGNGMKSGGYKSSGFKPRTAQADGNRRDFTPARDDQRRDYNRQDDRKRGNFNRDEQPKREGFRKEGFKKDGFKSGGNGNFKPAGSRQFRDGGDFFEPRGGSSAGRGEGRAPQQEAKGNKYVKPAAKKTFKFKEHSRKPNRGAA